MARFAAVVIGPASSTGSPMTFMMRPRHSSPTRTEIGAPVSRTSWPRTRPSETSMATLRDFEHQTVAVVGRLERVQDLRQVAVELHVDDRADDLGDVSNLVGFDRHVRLLQNA